MKLKVIRVSFVAILALTAALAAGLPLKMGLTPTTRAATLCVNPGGTSGCFTTIQGAINAASSGDIINIEAGTYTENLSITKTLTLAGAGQQSTIIDGAQVDHVVYVKGDIVVNISGVTIQHGKAKSLPTGDVCSFGFGGGICTISTTLTIHDSAVVSNTADAWGGIGNHRGALILFNVIVSGNIVPNTGCCGGISNGGVMTATNVTISENVAGSNGGLYNPGIATLTNVSITDNTATGSWGGAGIGNSYFNSSLPGILTLVNGTVSGNTATVGGGGGILNDFSSTLIVMNSTFASNTAGGAGAGVLNQAAAMTVTNGTFSSNTTTLSQGGGAIHSRFGTPSVTITNSTFVSNTAGSGGGSIRIQHGTATLRNTIVAFGSPNNCVGTIISNGHNLDSDNTCDFTATSDITNTNPLLSLMQNNGGPTLTHALLPGSPAIDASDSTGCPAADQRGVPRPQDGNGDSSAVCDMGAYEVVCNASIVAAWRSTNPTDIMHFDLNRDEGVNVVDVMLGVAKLGQWCQ